MEPNSAQMLGILMDTTRKAQASIENAVKELRGEIANVNAAAVAAQRSADEAKKAATVMRSAAETVVAAAAAGAEGAVGPAMKQAFEGASKACAAALTLAAKPTLDRFAGISQVASAAEQKIRNAGQWFSYKAMLLAAVSVGLVWAISWGGLLWERAEYAKLVEQNKELNAGIETAKVNLAALNAKGGKIKFSPSGCAGRPCIEVAENQGDGDKGWRAPWTDAQGKVRFVIPKGY